MAGACKSEDLSDPKGRSIVERFRRRAVPSRSEGSATDRSMPLMRRFGVVAVSLRLTKSSPSFRTCVSGSRRVVSARSTVRPAGACVLE
jgi:hypothetical protein